MHGLTLVSLPYDSGRFDERMGRGPLHLLKSGLAEHLRAPQRDVEAITIQLSDGFYSDTQALVALQRDAVAALRDSLDRDRRILVLSGNCGPAALSATAALDPPKTGVIWFDAHADFNTPETSASGFLDGMSLGMLDRALLARSCGALYRLQALAGSERHSGRGAGSRFAGGRGPQ